MIKAPPTKPFLSIITVTLNNINGLKKTAASITSQTNQDIEWIIIDGDSSDGTKSWLQQRSMEKLKWISEPDNGLYDAMNKGLAKSCGRYVTFLNSGDQFAKTQTIEEIKKYEDLSSHFIYGDAIELLKNNQTSIKKARPYNTIYKGLFTHHQAIIYKRTSIKNLKYNTAYKIAADYDFTARALQNAKKTTYINVPLCIFESGGLSEKNAAIGRQEELKIKTELKLSAPFKNRLVYMRQTCTAWIKKINPNAYTKIRNALR